MVVWLLDGEKSFICLTASTHYTNETDRRTDGHLRQHNPRYAQHRAVNKPLYCTHAQFKTQFMHIIKRQIRVRTQHDRVYVTVNVYTQELCIFPEKIR